MSVRRETKAPVEIRQQSFHFTTWLESFRFTGIILQRVYHLKCHTYFTSQTPTVVFTVQPYHCTVLALRLTQCAGGLPAGLWIIFHRIFWSVWLPRGIHINSLSISHCSRFSLPITLFILQSVDCLASARLYQFICRSQTRWCVIINGQCQYSISSRKYL